MQIDRKQVNEILHDYKKECFQLEHGSEHHDTVVRGRQKLVDEILAQNFHFHFHRSPTPQAAETFNIIENYVREAVLPPVVSKLAERVVLLEKRQAAGLKALERILDLIVKIGS
jgi:hypothetical protein